MIEVYRLLTFQIEVQNPDKKVSKNGSTQVFFVVFFVIFTQKEKEF